MKTFIVGCGTIGLAFGVALASHGNSVVLCDRDEDRLSRLQNDQLELDEPELRAALRNAISSGMISVSRTPELDGSASNFIICIPTPDASLSALQEVVLTISKTAHVDDAIFIRSTIPPGTTRNLHRMVKEELGRDLMFGAMPDRSVEGRTYADQADVPHLLGTIGAAAARRGTELLQTIGTVVCLPSAEAAEASKIFSNVWRAGTFALVNALTLIAEDHGLDMHEIIASASQGYPRFSPPRPGLVGGPCLPKDIRMLVDSTRPESRQLLEGIERSETALKERVISVAIGHLSRWRERQVRVAFLGLAFKGWPAVSDLRGSPALAIARDLAAAFPEVVQVGWDPSAVDPLMAGMSIESSPYDAVQGSLLTVVGHDHPRVMSIDWDEIYSRMEVGGLLLDLTGRAGIPSSSGTPCRYWGLGRNVRAGNDQQS